MGFVSSIFGGGSGAGFQAQGTNILQPATTDQANQLYGQAQGGINQQQQFVNALSSQGGIGNQSSVFGQQQALSNRLNQQAQGAGPNPALAQLSQTTGQNVAQQSALAGSQRGANANVGLLERQAAQVGSQAQQQASGQAATMRAQQQLAAQQLLQQQQMNMANLSTQQVGQQQTGLNSLNQLTQGEQGQILGSIANQNNANVQMQGNINNANSSVAAQNARTQGGLLGGVLGGVGSALGLSGSSYAQGGSVKAGPKSAFGQMMYARGGHIDGESLANSMQPIPGKALQSGDSLKNDKVPIMASPGETIIPRSKAKDPEKAAAFAKAVAMRSKRK